MKKLFQIAYGWPVLIGALVFGFGGAALSAMYKNHWWFIVGFAIDLVLVIGFIATCEDEDAPSPLMASAGGEIDPPKSAPVAPSDAAAANDDAANAPEASASDDADTPTRTSYEP